MESRDSSESGRLFPFGEGKTTKTVPNACGFRPCRRETILRVGEFFLTEGRGYFEDMVSSL